MTHLHHRDSATLNNSSRAAHPASVPKTLSRNRASSNSLSLSLSTCPFSRRVASGKMSGPARLKRLNRELQECSKDVSNLSFSLYSLTHSHTFSLSMTHDHSRASRLNKSMTRLIISLVLSPVRSVRTPPHTLRLVCGRETNDFFRTGTPYEGGWFSVDVQAPERYPFEPLKMKFITKVSSLPLSRNKRQDVDLPPTPWFKVYHPS